jgi:hypothetical protein
MSFEIIADIGNIATPLALFGFAIIKWYVRLQNKEVEIESSCLRIIALKEDAPSLIKNRLKYTEELNQKKPFSKYQTLLIDRLIRMNDVETLSLFVSNRGDLIVTKKGTLKLFSNTFYWLVIPVAVLVGIFGLLDSAISIHEITNNFTHYIQASHFLMRSPYNFISLLLLSVFSALGSAILFYLFFVSEKAILAFKNIDDQYKEDPRIPFSLLNLLFLPFSIPDSIISKLFSTVSKRCPK